MSDMDMLPCIPQSTVANTEFHVIHTFVIYTYLSADEYIFKYIFCRAFTIQQDRSFMVGLYHFQASTF